MSGWIKLHRKINKNALYPKNREFTKFEAWIDLILKVNHSDEEVLIKNEVYKCKRGQSVRSIETYQKCWNWSRQQVRSFFKMLQKNSMIELNTTTKTTILTVCNYDSYQSDKPTDNQRITNEQPTDNQRITINKNDKKKKNEKEYITSKTFYDLEMKNTNGDTSIRGYYAKFIDILYGKNDLGRELSELLNLDNQVTYKQFCKLYAKSVDKNKKFSQILPTMTNDKKYYKNKKSLYLCLNTWLNNDFK